jgi:hypothetical protein
MKFEEAATIYKQRIEGDISPKKHGKEYYFKGLITDSALTILQCADASLLYGANSLTSTL